MLWNRSPWKPSVIHYALAAFFAVGFLLRLYAAHFPNIIHPDAIFQTLEPAHRLAYGYGLTTLYKKDSAGISALDRLSRHPACPRRWTSNLPNAGATAACTPDTAHAYRPQRDTKSTPFSGNEVNDVNGNHPL